MCLRYSLCLMCEPESYLFNPLLIAACAAARRAMGTLKGEQDT